MAFEQQQNLKSKTYLDTVLDSVVPISLYQVKQIAKPKGGNVNTLRFFSVASLFIGFAIFIALFVTQRRNYTVETTVQTSDISSLEWACSMASVVSETVILNDTADPIQYYNMIKINELGGQCTDTLESILPCESSIVYQPGTYSLDYEVSISSVSPYSTGVLYLVASSGGTDVGPYKYDFYHGFITEGGGLYDSMTNTRNSVATDSNGLGVFVVRYGAEFMLMPWAESALGDNYVVCVFHPGLAITCTQVQLTNNNFFELFVVVSLTPVRNSTVSHYFQKAYEPLLSGLMIETNITNTILSFAVYSDERDSSLNNTYFYYVQTDYLNSFQGSIFLTYNGTVTPVAIEMNNIISIQVDSNHSYLYASYYDTALGISNIMRFKVSSGDLQHVEPEYLTPHTLGLFGLISDYFIIFNSPGNEITLKVHNISAGNNNSINVEYGYKDTTVGWAVCGNISSSVLPTSIETSTCKPNGLSWQQSYGENYYFTPAMFESKVMTLAQSSCNSTLYAQICENVGNQPPYICTRNVYTTFFTVLSTAIANAHLLTVVLLMILSGVLSRVKTKQEVTSPTKKDLEVEMSGGEVEKNPIL